MSSQLSVHTSLSATRVPRARKERDRHRRADSGGRRKARGTRDQWGFTDSKRTRESLRRTRTDLDGVTRGEETRIVSLSHCSGLGSISHSMCRSSGRDAARRGNDGVRPPADRWCGLSVPCVCVSPSVRIWSPARDRRAITRLHFRGRRARERDARFRLTRGCFPLISFAFLLQKHAAITRAASNEAAALVLVSGCTMAIFSV